MRKTELLPFTAHYDNYAVNAYSSAFYKFSNPTDDLKYVKTLRRIAQFNAEGIFPSRREILLSMNEPDPTVITSVSSWNNKKIRSNWGTSRFAALRQAGLIDFYRKGNTCYYFITERAISLLAESRDNSTADHGGCLVDKDQNQRKLFV